jgi:hypothetical protein
MLTLCERYSTLPSRLCKALYEASGRILGVALSTALAVSRGAELCINARFNAFMSVFTPQPSLEIIARVTWEWANASIRDSKYMNWASAASRFEEVIYLQPQNLPDAAGGQYYKCPHSYSRRSIDWKSASIMGFFN